MEILQDIKRWMGAVICMSAGLQSIHLYWETDMENIWRMTAWHCCTWVSHIVLLLCLRACVSVYYFKKTSAAVRVGVVSCFLPFCLLVCTEMRKTGRWKLLWGHPLQCEDKKREQQCRRGALPNTAERRGPRDQNQKSSDTRPDMPNKRANLQVKSKLKKHT